MWLASLRTPGQQVTCRCVHCGAINEGCPTNKLAKALKLAGKAITLTMERVRRKASRKQHGYWRGCVVPMIAAHIGHTKREHDAVHDALMRELVGLKEDSDPRLQIRASSADMDTGEFNEWLIEQGQIFAAEKLDLIIPDPDPAWRENKARAERLERAQVHLRQQLTEAA